MTDSTEMIPETKQRKISFLLCAFFLFCALLWNPGIFASPGRAQYLPFFTTGALSFLAIGLTASCSFVPSCKKYFRWTILLFCGLAAGQMAAHFSSWGITQFGEMLFWLAVPAAVCTHCAAFRKLLPVYVLTVGGYAFLSSAYLTLRNSWTVGITGNVNWTAALFVMTGIFLGGLTADRMKKCISTQRKKIILAFGIAGELLLFWQMWRIGSKGANLALALTAILYIFLRSGTKIRKIMLCSALLGLLAGAVWAVRNTDAIGKFLADDGRIILWENAVELIADHPLFGTGQGSYENEYMRCRKADYFFLLNPAARSNHPHNHLLFMTGSWGIAGVILWGILLFAPLAVVLRKHYRHETADPLETACFLTLCYALLHGSLDLILFSMPTSLISLMCLGILWRNLTDGSRKKSIPRAGRIIAALFMLALSLTVVRRSIHAALQVRKAYRHELTANEILETAKQCPGEYQANFALLRYLEKRGDPSTALSLTEIMLKSHTPNYPGLHMGRGNALMRLGRFREALAAYKVEAELFPVSLRPVYNMIVAAHRLKDSALAAKLEEELRNRMRIRGSDNNDLRIIITGKNGAHYDLRPREKPRP